MFLIRYFNGTLSNSVHKKLLWLVVLEFLIQHRSLVYIHTHTHTWQTSPDTMLIHLYWSFCMQSHLSSQAEAHEYCLRGGWKCILSIQRFLKEERLWLFYNHTLMPSRTYRCCTESEEWCPVQVERGRWNPQAGNEVAGQDAHPPTQQLLLLLLSIAPTSEGDKLSSKVSWFSCTKV